MDPRCRIRVRRTLFGCALLAALSGSVSAQPVEIVNTNQAMLTVPAIVTYKPGSNTNTLDTAEIGPFPAAETLERRPKAVPVFTYDEVTELTSPGAVIAEEKELPLKVVIQPNGDYELIVQGAIAETTVTEIPITYVVTPLPSTFVRVPERVVVDIANGNAMTTEVTTIGPVTGGSPDLAKPARVPVESLAANGARSPGVAIRNDEAVAVPQICVTIPGWVEPDGNGVFVAKTVSYAYSHSGDTPEGRMIPAGFVAEPPEATSIPVRYSPYTRQLRQINDRQGWQFDINIVDPGFISPADTTSLRSTLDRVANYFLAALADSTGHVIADFTAVTNQPNGTIMGTGFWAVDISYDEVRSNLLILSFLEETHRTESWTTTRRCWIHRGCIRRQAHTCLIHTRMGQYNTGSTLTSHIQYVRSGTWLYRWVHLI